MIKLYAHAGSGNHGCEALVRTIAPLCPQKPELITYNKDEDYKYGVEMLVENISEITSIRRWSFKHIVFALAKRLLKLDFGFRYRYNSIISKVKKHDIMLSIGGDNYCGYGMNNTLAELNKAFKQKGAKTALIGCSVEPILLKDCEALKDFQRYDLITARETLTYQAMIDAGLKQVKLIPDSAFVLETELCDLPDGFVDGNTVGINISPLIQAREKKSNITQKNYETLIEWVLKQTDMTIALIPHVIWNSNDDLVPLKQLYAKYKETGRVVLIDAEKTLNCKQIKYVISRCRFLITARTHASIAAYSTCVPTLVIGYSVKAKGLALDLFGDYSNYVMPVQELQSSKEILDKFLYIYEHEQMIKQHLQSVIPQYIQDVHKLKSILEKL